MRAIVGLRFPIGNPLLSINLRVLEPFILRGDWVPRDSSPTHTAQPAGQPWKYGLNKVIPLQLGWGNNQIFHSVNPDADCYGLGLGRGGVGQGGEVYLRVVIRTALKLFSRGGEGDESQAD